MAICLLLIVAILNHSFLRLVDFIMTYTQAPIEFNMYMTFPQGMSKWFGHAKDMELHLIKAFMGKNK